MKCQNVNSNEGTDSRTSTSLLRRARENDANAWNELVETYGRRVYRWCRKAGLQTADASNVVQEVLRSVARKLEDFRRDRQGDTFRGWIRRITQNKLKDHFRGKTRQIDFAAGGTDAHQRLVNVVDQNADGQFAASELLDDDLRETSSTGKSTSIRSLDIRLAEVDRVRAEFSDRDWRFFWRVVVDGQSAVEVADEFGVTANTVRIVKTRILKRFRQEFGNS